MPAVFALTKETLHVRFPLGALRAAPQGDDDRDDDGQRGPEEQRPLLPGAAVVPQLVPLRAHPAGMETQQRGMLESGNLEEESYVNNSEYRQDVRHVFSATFMVFNTTRMMTLL